MAVQQHQRLGSEHLGHNAGLGRHVFLPGEPGRAGRIGEQFEGARSRRAARPA